MPDQETSMAFAARIVNERRGELAGIGKEE